LTNTQIRHNAHKEFFIRHILKGFRNFYGWKTEEYYMIIGQLVTSNNCMTKALDLRNKVLVNGGESTTLDTGMLLLRVWLQRTKSLVSMTK
jgi:hypothetical protein